MNISELKNHLDNIEEAHGDMKVIINDADTQWLFELVENDLTVITDELGTRLEIDADYQSNIFDGTPEGTPM